MVHLFLSSACFLLQVGYKQKKQTDSSSRMVENTVPTLMTSSKREMTRDIVSSSPPFSVPSALNTPGVLNAGAGRQESQVQAAFPFSIHL